MARVGFAYLSLIGLAVMSHAQETFSSDEWDRADKEVVRLAPEAFDELPRQVKKELDRRQCTIPQVSGEWGDDRHNVVRGRFKRPDQIDIAVLCSRNRVSSILVFPGGSVREVQELASVPDNVYLQRGVDRKIIYSRNISVADEETIRRYHAWFGGPALPPLNHDGINDSFAEKGSTVLYWHAGEWRTLRGMD